MIKIRLLNHCMKNCDVSVSGIEVLTIHVLIMNIKVQVLQATTFHVLLHTLQFGHQCSLSRGHVTCTQINITGLHRVIHYT